MPPSHKYNHELRLTSWLSVLLLACLLGLSVHAQEGNAQPGAGEQNNEQPAVAEPGLTVRELLVLQTDRYGEIANFPGEVRSTLFVPIPHAGRIRLSAPRDTYLRTAMPIGIISFQGEIKEPMAIQLRLASETGFFHAHWPEDALKGPRTIEWQQLKKAGQRQGPAPLELGNHWLAPLRDMEDRLWLSTRDPMRKERFMLYDASLPFAPDLDLQPTDEGYRLVNKQPDKTPPLALLLALQDKQWCSVALNSPWDKPDESIITADMLSGKSEQDVANTKQSPLIPLAEWLGERGYNRQEVLTAMRMVAASGMERSSMSLVYILPEQEIDKHIQLRFKPQPDRVVRTTIVVVNNVDPELGNRLDQLIQGLGDDRWKVRERSQRDLQSIGLAAIRKVQGAKNSKDPEVAFRARQILDEYDRRQEALGE